MQTQLELRTADLAEIFDFPPTSTQTGVKSPFCLLLIPTEAVSPVWPDVGGLGSSRGWFHAVPSTVYRLMIPGNVVNPFSKATTYPSIASPSHLGYIVHRERLNPAEEQLGVKLEL